MLTYVEKDGVEMPSHEDQHETEMPALHSEDINRDVVLPFSKELHQLRELQRAQRERNRTSVPVVHVDNAPRARC